MQNKHFVSLLKEAAQEYIIRNQVREKVAEIHRFFQSLGIDTSKHKVVYRFFAKDFTAYVRVPVDELPEELKHVLEEIVAYDLTVRYKPKSVLIVLTNDTMLTSSELDKFRAKRIWLGSFQPDYEFQYLSSPEDVRKPRIEIYLLASSSRKKS